MRSEEFFQTCHPERSAAESKDLTRCTERAYGKLNLTLEVLGKRDDGYHDLRMVMCSVALHDELTITLGAGYDACTVRAAAGEIPGGEQNLAMKAARAFAEAAGVDFGGIVIDIVKRIPAQAGMAGGSSDAAAVLRALNRYYGACSDEALRAVGLSVGSDVPYCIFGGAALAEGRGERLTRLPDLPGGLCAVLVRPDFSVSTPALFRALDESRDRGFAIARPCAQRGNPHPPACHPERSEAEAKDLVRTGATVGRPSPTDAMAGALRSGDAAAIGNALSNDFSPVLSKQYPVVEVCKQRLRSLGALGSELTGTGSVIFGLFDNSETADRAAAALSREYPFAAATTFL